MKKGRGGRRLSSVALRAAALLFVQRWLSKRGLGSWGSVLLGCLAVANLHNTWLETSRKEYTDILHLAQTVLFIVRKSSVVLVRRSFGYPRHPYWNGVEEIAMSTVNFAARIGHVTAPRAVLEQATKLQGIVARNVTGAVVEDVDLGLQGPHGRDALWMSLSEEVRLGSEKCDGVILYFHGGGYAVGTAGMYTIAMLELLKKIQNGGMNVGILSIEYPLAPETKFPENIEFCKRAFEFIVDVYSVQSIVIGGDSAGGGLALAVTKHSFERREKGPQVAGLILISPWVSHSTDSESHDLHIETDCIAGKDLQQSYSIAYCGCHNKAQQHPSISPIHADVNLSPPVFLTVGTREVFADDLYKFKSKMQQSGLAVEIDEGVDCPHIYPVFWPMFQDESTRALQRIADFTTKRMKFRKQNPDACRWSERVCSF